MNHVQEFRTKTGISVHQAGMAHRQRPRHGHGVYGLGKEPADPRIAFAVIGLRRTLCLVFGFVVVIESAYTLAGVPVCRMQADPVAVLCHNRTTVGPTPDRDVWVIRRDCVVGWNHPPCPIEARMTSSSASGEMGLVKK